MDAEQGVIAVRFQSDKTRVYEMVLPGLIVDQNEQPLGPTADAQNPLIRPVSFDAVSNSNQVPKLSQKWNLAVILTAVPAAPNDERQLEVGCQVLGQQRELLVQLPPSPCRNASTRSA